MVMHKKCIAVVRIVRIVSGFWHNSGKLSDNSELREFSDRLVRVRRGKVREIKSPQGIFWGVSRVRACGKFWNWG